MTDLEIFAGISMGAGEWVGIVGVAVTILIAVITAVYKAGKKEGGKAQRLTDVENDIKDNIKPELKSLRDTMTESAKEIQQKLEEILRTMTLKQVSQSESPRALNDFGKKVLGESEIRSIIEPKLEQIVESVSANHPENAYQVQEMVLDIVQDLKDNTEIKNAVEQAAYKSGVSVETVLLVGGIDIRDLVLEKLDMSPKDIDPSKPKSSS